ncbi:MAG: LacI family DNA-binding transcriptional regulator [Oscillospiraceae bacterium]|nr:LacI family DNA-binding transcriptional regulator [Oscillospiraceae bacterium]
MATIKDVAKAAGVSVATVSRVLNASENVRPETVEAVKRAISELDYHPNFLGRTLRRLETMKILVMVPTISNQFYSRVIRGIQSVARQNGYHVMLGITESDPDAEQEYVEMARRKLVDGVIFLYSSLPAKEITELAQSCPAVFANECVPGAEVSAVSIDNRQAGYDAAEFLIRNGHRTIAFVSAGMLYGSSSERREGFCAAMLDAGLSADEKLFIDEGLTFKAGRRAATRLLQGKLPDAVFAASDSAAIGLISSLEEKGIRVGKDISVMGFDDNQIAEYFIPALTTVSQPQIEIGQKAMELLIEKMHDLTGEAKQIVLPHRLEIRNSVRLTTVTPV